MLRRVPGRQLRHIRWATTLSETAGVAPHEIMPQNHNEKLFYYNQLFPPTGVFTRFMPPVLWRWHYSDLCKAITDSLPKDLDAEVVAVLPRPSEGGAYVKFKTSEPQALEEAGYQGLHRHFMIWPQHSRGFPVNGIPWITDMPKALSRTVLVTPPLPDEEAYELLRPYGRIKNIHENAIQFFRLPDAIAARNCAHREPLPGRKGERIRLTLQTPENYYTRIKNWLSGHPRVSLPIILALLFALAYAIFEPVREFSIQMHVRNTLTFAWLRKRLGRFKVWPLQYGDSEERASFAEQTKLASSIEALKGYIAEASSTFIVVAGPKGSGKDRTVTSAISPDEHWVLNVDCENLGASKSDVVMLRTLAKNVGYWPQFSWFSRLSKFVELAIQSVTGQSAGLTETSDQAVRRILETTATALSTLGTRTLNKSPIVVLRGWSYGSHIDELLAEWAASLVQGEIAQVIFVTNDVEYGKTLSKLLPGRMFKVVSVEDASSAAAKEYVLSHFKSLRSTPQDLSPQAHAAIREFEHLPHEFLRPLGGRLSDLQTFTRRLLTGESPEAALKLQINQAALEVLQLHLTASNEKWTTAQAWTLVQLLGSADPHCGWLSVPGTLNSTPAFKGPGADEALKALEAAEMISTRAVGGLITGVKANRPLYDSAFHELTQDPLVSSVMTVNCVRSQIASETSYIATLEKELVQLAEVPKNTANSRQEYLSAQLTSAQSRLTALQEQLNAANSTLSKFEWFGNERERKDRGWFGNSAPATKFQ